MNITRCFVEKLKLPTASLNQKRYYDDCLKGFGIRVTINGIKSFFIEKCIGTKVYRATLGHYPALTVENARKKAQDYLGKIAMGIDPTEEKLEAKIKGITLQAAFNDFLNARKNLKHSTICCYTRIMQDTIANWQNKPLISINKDMIIKKHAEIGMNSKAHANLTMRILRAIFTFAAGNYNGINSSINSGINKQSLFIENPVKILSYSRAWYAIKRRTTVITPSDLPSWYKAVEQLATQPLIVQKLAVQQLKYNGVDDGIDCNIESKTIIVSDYHVKSKAAIVRDYLLLILFTGLRRQEAAQLKWENIDFNNKTLTVTDTKNHLHHTLPLSSFLYELLYARYINNGINNHCRSNYVFPGAGDAGYLVEPQKQINKVIKASGVQFTLHDLRRTFITVAESLDIPAYALKRLLNHKEHDVTAGYIIIDTERLRRPMQLISDKLLSLVNVTITNTPISDTLENIGNSIETTANPTTIALFKRSG